MIHCDRRLFNPNGFWLWRYALDTSVRYVVLYGGSSSGKSFSAAQVLSIISFAERTNTLVMRKVGNTIEKSIYTDFKTAIKGVKGLADHCRFKINSIVFDNGAKIDFTGIDDPEKIKGISQYKRVLLDELSEFDESDFKQIRLRLRGMEGQQIVATFNPVSEGHWIKKRWFDREEWHAVPLRLSFAGEDLPEALCRVRGVRMNAEKTILNPSTGEYERHAPDTVVVHSTYLDNFWVVGSPDGRYGYYDHQAIANYEYNRVHDPDYYHIYALGEWGHIRTGAEFFPSFSPSAVCGAFPFKEGLPVHVSMDSNVLPYVTATFFQKEYRGDVEEVTQFAELPVESPDNSARKAARKIAAFLADMGYRDTLYLHGDASGRAANTIDPDNRSFFDLVIDELEKEGFAVEDCVAAKNPSVALSGEFINAVWDGRVENVSIRVDEGCAVSIGDYQAVQKDENGAILKQRVRDPVTKQSYEPWGHCSDTLRYACIDLLRRHFTDFSMGRKRSLYAEGEFGYFNPSANYEYERTLSYILPSFGGLFILARVGKAGDDWHLTDAMLREVRGNDEMAEAIAKLPSDRYVVECPPAWFPFVRSLRGTLSGVDVMRMGGDHRLRIAAMSDWVRAHVLIRPDATGEYGRFIADALDYTPSSPTVSGASAALSGIARVIARGGVG